MSETEKRQAEHQPENEPSPKKRATATADASLAHVYENGLLTLLTHDQQKTLDFYCSKLGYKADTDTEYGSIRWLTMKPSPAQHQTITVVKAETEATKAAVGKQAGDHVFMVLHTKDMAGDYARLKDDPEVKIVTELTEEFWGHSCVLLDDNGNRINLLQVKPH